MSLQTPRGSNLTTVGTRRREEIFPERRTRSSHISARARIGARSSVRGGIDAASTTVKRSHDGVARRRSQLRLQEGQAAAARVAASGTGMKTSASLEAERLVRFASDQGSGMRVLMERATILVACKSRKASGREAVLR